VPRPHLRSGSPELDEAFDIALSDIESNIVPLRDGRLREEAPVLRAGADYELPWTRDAAINTWNGLGLLAPSVARNTLLATLTNDGPPRIDEKYGQLWDAVIWVLGAYYYYLYTGDRGFLGLMLEVCERSFPYFDEQEFDREKGLFRGPACYGDGISAYPDEYSNTAGSPGIAQWRQANPTIALPRGTGVPVFALSTNCVYQHAFMLASRAAAVLGRPADGYARRADDLANAIRRIFWNPELGHFLYLVSDLGDSHHQEGLGQAFALLFGIATEHQAQSVLACQVVTEAGVPCVWPPFERYTRDRPGGYPRHAGTVWPPIQAFFGEAAARRGRTDLLIGEIRRLARAAVRDGEFRELYHPVSTEPYGGLQERNGDSFHLWPSFRRQSWSATGFVRLVLMGLLGLRFDEWGVQLEPCLPDDINAIELSDLRYRNATLSIRVRGGGAGAWGVELDGRAAPAGIPCSLSGAHQVVLTRVE
jgi:glycogen debranching enzyme